MKICRYDFQHTVRDRHEFLRHVSVGCYTAQPRIQTPAMPQAKASEVFQLPTDHAPYQPYSTSTNVPLFLAFSPGRFFGFSSADCVKMHKLGRERMFWIQHENEKPFDPHFTSSSSLVVQNHNIDQTINNNKTKTYYRS